MPTSHILVTGGAGFIGSHTCVALTAAGYTPIVLDSFSNSDVRVLDRIERISGQRPLLVQGDVRDGALLSRVFEQHAVAGVIHFAGLKAVGDSVADPLQYYDVNVGGTVILARAMAAAQVKTLIFSSSATVYGEPERSPIPEEAPYAAASPYGRTKRMVEEILADCQEVLVWAAAVDVLIFNGVVPHRRLC